MIPEQSRRKVSRTAMRVVWADYKRWLDRVRALTRCGRSRGRYSTGELDLVFALDGRRRKEGRPRSLPFSGRARSREATGCSPINEE